MSTGLYRKELPEPPTRIARLPVDPRGYPVPWFCVWLDEHERPVKPGHGRADFRVLFPGAVAKALREQRCWICGGYIHGSRFAYVAGPMCAINRTSAEPPSHEACARYAVMACPFLTKPHMVRRDAGMPEQVDRQDVPGMMIERNPGATMIWHTNQVIVRQVDNGILFDIGQPKRVEWWAEGEPATRAEVLESIHTGLPVLIEACELDTDPAASRADLQRRVDSLQHWLPDG